MAKYQPIPKQVEAVQLSTGIPGVAEAGDWLVIHEDAKQEFIADAVFQATYQEVPTVATLPLVPSVSMAATVPLTQPVVSVNAAVVPVTRTESGELSDDAKMAIAAAAEAQRAQTMAAAPAVEPGTQGIQPRELAAPRQIYFPKPKKLSLS